MLRRNNTNLVQADGDLDRDTIIMERGGWNFRCLCRYLETDTRGDHYVGCILAEYEYTRMRDDKIMEPGDDGMFRYIFCSLSFMNLQWLMHDIAFNISAVEK